MTCGSSWLRAGESSLIGEVSGHSPACPAGSQWGLGPMERARTRADTEPMSSTATSFRVIAEITGDVHVVAVTGELDVSTISVFRDALSRAAGQGATRLVVDLSRSAFVDSVGVGAILHAKRRLGPDG